MQFAGPKRVRPCPVVVKDLPPVDAVVISHNHYDHLDITTVRDLSNAQPGATFFVPLGMKAWFASVLGQLVADSTVVEMDWGEEAVLHDTGAATTADATATTTGTTGTGTTTTAPRVARVPLTVVCVPCQHWCKRTLTDLNKCLWSSWICKTPSMTYYFGGDTGYCGKASPSESFSLKRLAADPARPPVGGRAGHKPPTMLSLHALPRMGTGVMTQKWYSGKPLFLPRAGARSSRWSATSTPSTSPPSPSRRT